MMRCLLKGQGPKIDTEGEQISIAAVGEAVGNVLVDEGPLVLVETKKDLSQVRLPFESQTPGA